MAAKGIAGAVFGRVKVDRVFFIGICLIGFCASAAAQNVPSSVQPGHERQILSEPPAPLSRPALPLIQLPATMGPAEAAKIRLRVKRFVIEGSSVYAAADFTPLYANLIGKQVTAADIYALAASISAKYGHDGYLVARAVLTPQAVDAKAATIHIRVVEGYIERIEWPTEAARYRDLFTPCLDQIKSERPTRTKTLERCLLLASDLPGLRFSSTLKAGKNPNGGAVLVVSLTEKPFEAFARIDNRGAPGRGPWQWLGSVTENNRLGMHESFNLTYSSAFDTNELQYLSGTYHQALLPNGLYFEVNGYGSKGAPNLPATAAINYRANSDGVEGGLTDPVIRSREQNLSLSALAFAEHAYSNALDSPLSEDRLRGVRLRANYDQVDTWLSTVGLTQVITTYSQGFNGVGSTSNGNPLASVAGGRVDFSKLEVFANRTQALAYGFSLYGAASAQWAGSTLLVPEECGYGGRFFGRAFDPFALAGDSCWQTLGELRYDPSIPNNRLTQTELYTFADQGFVTRLAPSVGTPKNQSASSAGVGLRLAWKANNSGTVDNLALDVQAAKPIAVASGVDSGWRYFLILTARY